MCGFSPFIDIRQLAYLPSFGQVKLRLTATGSDLEQLRKDYSEMIVKSYKSRSERSRAMFLLSSQNFMQAYKRVQYMKQYAGYRKSQGDEIKVKSTELAVYNEKLAGLKIEKIKVIQEQEKEKQVLLKEKKEKEVLVNSIKKDKKKIIAEIKKKQQEANEIDKKIQRFIRDAIAAENKKTAKKAGPKTVSTGTSATKIVLTEEGKIESDKTIGFGFDGKKTFTYNDTSGAEITTTYTSINNIGSAQLTLGYMPVGANSITNEYKTSFTTNNETGEFRVNLLPLSYIISQNDLRFVSGINPDNNPLLTADMPINFTAIKAFQYPTFVQGSTTITGEPYQEILKFTHIAIPQHNVINQTSDTTITADGINYTISPNQNPPIYTQFADYSISIQSLERYFNYDINPNDPEISVVPVVGSTLIKTNNLALENSESIKVSDLDPSILIYSFKGGIPNTDSATNFKRTLNLKIRSNGIDYPVINYKTEGIILGGVADGSQTFVTAGPEIPDFVLRDPPGSFSSASIEKGSSFSFLRENTSNTTIGNETNATVSLGFTLSVGGGLAGPVMESETVADTTTGILMQQSSSNGKSITNTYTFNQTITTNSDPDWIGSDADLYIGTSANQFYGTYDELVVSSTSTNSTPINVLNASGVSMILHPKINKALYFSESPEKTLFVYSQRNILNDVIPKYQNFIDQIDNGTLLENQNGVLSREAYVSSINLWRKIILNNELVKYQAFKNRNALKTSLDDIVESLKDPETGALSETAKQLKDLLDATFYENISFDAGVGEFTKGFSVERLTTSTLSYELQIDSSVAVAIGADFNDTGFQMETTTNNTGNSSNTNEDTSDETTTISYTLSDTDPGNIFSVDVINPFDGNGPIFITKAGETSCPYETEELSYFYNPNHENVKNPSALIINF